MITRLIKNNTLICLILLVIFTPTFPELTKHISSNNAYYGKILTLIILIGFPLIFINFDNIFKDKATKFALVYSLLFFLLTTLSLIFDYNSTVLRDFVELFKPITAFIIFVLAYQTGYKFLQERNKSEDNKIHLFDILLISVPLLGIAEVHFGFDSLTQLLYVKTRPVLEGKALSPFGITYFFGTFVIFSYFFFIFKAILIDKRYGIFILVCLYSILLCQSRTIFIALIVGTFCLGAILVYFKLYSLRKILVIFSILLLFGLYVALFHEEYIKTKFHYIYVGLHHMYREGIDVTGNGKSVGIRFSQMIWSYQNSTGFKLLGSGIGKGYKAHLESFYALYMYRYGFIGIALYISLAFYTLITAVIISKHALAFKHFYVFSFCAGLSLFIVVLPILSFSSAITDQFVLQPLYYGFIGVLFALKHKVYVT